MNNAQKDLKFTALKRIRDAKNNDKKAARKILEESVFYLNNLTKGVKVQDSEKLIYFKYLKECLIDILKGVEPKKALFLQNEKNSQMICGRFSWSLSRQLLCLPSNTQPKMPIDCEAPQRSHPSH
jgi:hypothetical protein